MKKFGEWANVLFAILKGFKDVVTALIFVVLLVAFFFPSFRSQFGIFLAKNYGLKGYAYYEVDNGGQLTTDGRLYLLKEADQNASIERKIEVRKYDKLEIGDKLMAADGVNLRTSDNKDNRTNIIMMLSGGNCVVVLDKKREVKQIQNKDGSGGWLLVATAACELFDRPKPFS